MNYDACERELLELTEDPGFESALIDETRKAMLETAAENQTERMDPKNSVSEEKSERIGKFIGTFDGSIGDSSYKELRSEYFQKKLKKSQKGRT
jgi:hypothetical protein